MANHQKFIKYLLSFVIALSPVLLINNANAGALGGWTMGNPVAQGASAIVSATKNVMLNGSNVVKTSTALITPAATDVAKLLGKGVGGVALAFAVEQMLGAVDWVLDPANNQIKYTAECEASSTCPTSQYLYLNQHTYETFSSASAACSSIQTHYQINRGDLKLLSFTTPANKNYICLFTIEYEGRTSTMTEGAKIINPNYDANAEKDQKTIPLPTVANQVISNAQSGNADAQAVTVAAAADIINDAENDSTKARPIVNQLENNSKTATEETATGKAETKADEQTQTSNPATTPNTGNTTTDIILDFPVFCGWAPTVCEAMKVVLNVPTLVSEYAESVKEYFKEDTATDTTIDIPELPNQDIDTDINFSSACPANYTLANFSYHGTSQNWEVDFSKFCDVFGTYVKPVVIAMGAFSAALIIGGVRTND